MGLLSPQTYPGSTSKKYGATNNTNTTPSVSRRSSNNSNNDDYNSTASSAATPYTTPQHQSTSSIPRNESAGGNTVQTTETEPLLGEQLLLSGNDLDEPQDINPKSMFLSPIAGSGSEKEDSDAPSPIEKSESDHDMDTASGTTGGGGGGHHGHGLYGAATASTSTPTRNVTNDSTNKNEHKSTTPTRSNSPRKQPMQQNPFSSRGSLSMSNSNSDPHIGLNVITNELDTLAYSRDPDESTLLTNDNFFTKKYDAKHRPGLLWRVFFPLSRDNSSSYEGEDPPYLLVCLGLGVGIALCSIAALVYAGYNHHIAISTSSDNATTTISSSTAVSTSEGTWHGMPYTKIGRESFNDPVSNILDVSLFHPSLLFDPRAYGGRRNRKLINDDDDDDDDANNNKNDTTTAARSRQLGGTSLKPFLRVPFPTGAFWTNLVLLPAKQMNQQQQPTQSSNNQFSYPIVAYPYAYQWNTLGKLQVSYSANRRVVQTNSIQDAFAPDITLGSSQAIHTRHVVKFDSLSVTLKFYAGSSSSTDNWETYIVQGSPYITAKYVGLSPELTALSDFVDITCPPPFQEETISSSVTSTSSSQSQPQQQQKPKDESNRRRLQTTTSTPGKKLGICSLATDSTHQKKVITGVQFIVTTQEGLTWLVFTSEPITFEFNQAARRSIMSRNKYDGVVRVALVPDPLSTTTASETIKSGTTTSSSAENSLDVELATSPGVKRLVYHAGAYPVGGSVSWNFFSGTRQPLASMASSGHRALSDQAQRRTTTTDNTPKENNIGRVTFAFDTQHMTTSSPGSTVPLLMLALPHHAASITFADELLLRHDDFDLIYRSIKGRMVPVIGNTWSYEEELTFMGFGDEAIPQQQQTPSSSGTGTSSSTSHPPIVHESTAISTLDQSVRDLLIKTVEADMKINLPVVTNGAYGFGKQIARMAQLAHIGAVVDAANTKEIDALVDEIKKNTTTTTKDGSSSSNSQASSSTSSSSSTLTTSDGSTVTGSGTARRGYALLEKYLTMWLVGDGNDKKLVYDAQLGGILSKEGMQDINSDFGNARYNDHHFHYGKHIMFFLKLLYSSIHIELTTLLFFTHYLHSGYVLYAAAILGRANPKFISQYGPYVDALFYDVAHNSADAKPNNDKEIFFPLARHKSWFDGHSFASGLFPFANGKSQESSSEAVNCYFGAYLWSRVRWGSGADRRMVDYARLLLATEITGAKTYWHMTPNTKGGASVGSNSTSTTLAASKKSDTSLVLPVAYGNSAFRKNYMVGNLGMTDVTCTTWFGNENIYVHLINFMPVTAITAELFDKGKPVSCCMRSLTAYLLTHHISTLNCTQHMSKGRDQF